MYIVSTPIGNLQDITIRAANTLLDSKVIVTESTSKAGILLDFLEKEFGRKRFGDLKIISMTEEEEENKIPLVLSVLKTGDVSLISEAGTPLISDPGFKLVREAIKRRIRIIPVPGPSSVTAALTVSGLPTNRFTFVGFLPKSGAKRKRELMKVGGSGSTIILFESPQRIVEVLGNIQELYGNIEIVLARELTKIHEEIIRGKVSEILVAFERKAPKGEFIILFYS